MSILICLVSGLFWALFDLTRKLSLNHTNPKVLLILFTFSQIIIFFFWCVKESFFFIFIPYFLPGFSLLIIGVFSALIFLRSIKDSELSLTIPLLSFSPLFSSLFSFIFLKEELSEIQYIGIFLIIFGTLTLYSKKLDITNFFKSFQNIKNSQSALLMILVSFCWSLTPVLDKVCLNHSSINIHGLIQAFFTFFILFLFSKKEISNFKKLENKKPRLLFLTVSVGTIATILQFYAILLNFVPIMESIKRATGQFCAVFFGKLFFNETVNLQKIIGVFIISIGVSFII